MLVALGENEVKTLEDLADCATDDLAGWIERHDKETTRYPGFLDGFGMTRPQCEDLILAARVKAGWIDEADLISDETEETVEDGAGGTESVEVTEGNDEASGEDATAS
jgi:N utilization substance protein A